MARANHAGTAGVEAGLWTLWMAGGQVPPACARRASACAGMNILLLGSGGREHALAWKIAASAADRPALSARRAMPASRSEAECVALDIADHAAVIAFCKAQQDRFRRGRAGGAAGRRHRRRSRSRRHQDVRPDAKPPRGSKARRASPRICAAPTTSRPRAYERFTVGRAGEGLCRASRARRS